MPWPQTGEIQYHAQLGLPDKGRAIKGLVVCNNLDLEHLDLRNGLALGCYQTSPEVLIVLLFYSVAVAHPTGVGEVMGSLLGPNRVIAKDGDSCTYCCYVRCAILIV